MANEFVARKGLISLQTSSFYEDVYVSGSVYIGTVGSSSKFVVSGSGYISEGLIVDGGITGSLYGTASWAESASIAVNAETASYLNPLSQDVYITGSFNVSGSTLQVGNNTLVGNTTLSGSVNISGSTTQVGNNTLFGNTILSGSIIISGAFGTNNPTIKIYGDTEHNGYIRFDPVNTSIDQNISASYIYVSGSTNDLYFTQNGGGYNNTTRLRWLEGNLYTGLLHGGEITTQSQTVYQVSSGSGIIVDLNASLNDNPYPIIQYINWPNLSASIAPLSASYDQSFVCVDSAGSIYTQGTPLVNGQYDSLISIGLVLHSNRSTINGVKTQPAVSYGYEQRQTLFSRAFGPLKLSGFTLVTSGSSTGGLIVSSGTAYSDGASYTVDPNNPSYVIDNGTNISKIWRYYQTGSGWVYLTNAGAGFPSIDPTQYSNNGTLTAVTGTGANRKWSIQRVYWFPNSVSKAIVVYYGNAEYTTELDAIANINIETFVEAPNTRANALYLGAIVVRNNADFTNATSFKIIPSGLFRSVGGSGGGGSTITQTLSALSDVSISGPTDGQALVYHTAGLHWQNSSFISASISGNANSATTAISASVATNAQTASYVNTLNQDVYISGSLTVSGSTNIVGANGQTILFSNADVIEFTGSFLLTGSMAVTGSLSVTGLISGTASYALTASYIDGGFY